MPVKKSTSRLLKRQIRGKGFSDILKKTFGYVYDKAGTLNDYFAGKKYLSTLGYSIAETLDKVPHLVPEYIPRVVDRFSGYLEHKGYGSGRLRRTRILRSIIKEPRVLVVASKKIKGVVATRRIHKKMI